MSSEETEAASPPWGSHRTGRRDSGHLAGSPSARWSGTEPTISRMPSQEVGRGCGQTKEDGAYVHQHLNFISFGRSMEERPRLQTGPREIRLSGIIGGPPETWPWWK